MSNSILLEFQSKVDADQSKIAKYISDNRLFNDITWTSIRLNYRYDNKVLSPAYEKWAYTLIAQPEIHQYSGYSPSSTLGYLEYSFDSEDECKVAAQYLLAKNYNHIEAFIEYKYEIKDVDGTKSGRGTHFFMRHNVHRTPQYKIVTSGIID